MKAINYRSYLIKTAYVHAISDEKYGIVTLNDELVVPIKYDRITNYLHQPFAEHHQVWRNDSTGLYDQFGNIIIPVAYDKIEKSQGRCIIVSKNNLYGIYLTDDTKTGRSDL